VHVFYGRNLDRRGSYGIDTDHQLAIKLEWPFKKNCQRYCTYCFISSRNFTVSSQNTSLSFRVFKIRTKSPSIFDSESNQLEPIVTHVRI
jgi:hypothetical protein